MVDDRLKKIFKEVFGNDNITEETTIGEFKGWDSFGHVNLMTHIEKEFKVKISIAKSQELRSVKKIMDLIK